MNDKPIKVERERKFGAAQWAWLIVLTGTFFGPLAVWLYRLALGL